MPVQSYLYPKCKRHRAHTHAHTIGINLLPRKLHRTPFPCCMLYMATINPIHHLFSNIPIPITTSQSPTLHPPQSSPQPSPKSTSFPSTLPRSLTSLRHHSSSHPASSPPRSFPSMFPAQWSPSTRAARSRPLRTAENIRMGLFSSLHQRRSQLVSS